MGEFFGDVTEKGVGEAAMDRFRGSREERQERRLQTMYRFQNEQLMKTEGKYTLREHLRSKRAYAEKMRFIGPMAGVMSFLGKVPGTERTLKELDVLESLTQDELDQASAKTINMHTRKLIAEIANVDLNFVKQCLLDFEVLRTDRTWLFRRQMMGKKLPETTDEREFLASWDRPLHYPMRGMEVKEMLKRMDKKRKYTFPRRKSWIWLRHRSTGFSRWATQPNTKRYPAIYYASALRKRWTPRYHMYLRNNPPKIKER